jgi:hypothetical protein
MMPRALNGYRLILNASVRKCIRPLFKWTPFQVIQAA